MHKINRCHAVLAALLVTSGALSGSAAMASPLQATPLLRCQVTYADTTHTIETTLAFDPYSIESVDIGGRFRFKAVMIGHEKQITYIKLYAYLDTRRQPILIHQASYLPPFKPSIAAYPLTGQHRLYASSAERELLYGCTLEGVTE